MTYLCIGGLVWLSCAAVFVLGLCAAAHRAYPSVDEVGGANNSVVGETSHQGTDFLRKAA